MLPTEVDQALVLTMLPIGPLLCKFVASADRKFVSVAELLLSPSALIMF